MREKKTTYRRNCKNCGQKEEIKKEELLNDLSDEVRQQLDDQLQSRGYAPLFVEEVFQKGCPKCHPFDKELDFQPRILWREIKIEKK